MESVLTKNSVNKTIDLGNLLISDGSSFENISSKDLLSKTKENACLLYKAMYQIKEQTSDDIDYTKPLFQIGLPDPSIQFPRALPIPKEKPLTKWEKFKKEKGIAPRKKRSRLVYDETQGDWVPRWGHKGIQENKKKAQWIVEEKD